ncbi:hypothetical protein CEXT_359451 [Caerostris extrusa]|uniref:Uncharacterized protein n=1 Tax=Caerostris extrusa TaxID=172846 RepID=A0AAV4XGN6_CAEEX|nr:hypothetical protein CEXT_359451 [Caerostris extrusa]
MLLLQLLKFRAYVHNVTSTWKLTNLMELVTVTHETVLNCPVSVNYVASATIKVQISHVEVSRLTELQKLRRRVPVHWSPSQPTQLGG